MLSPDHILWQVPAARCRGRRHHQTRCRSAVQRFVLTGHVSEPQFWPRGGLTPHTEAVNQAAAQTTRTVMSRDGRFQHSARSVGSDVTSGRPEVWSETNRNSCSTYIWLLTRLPLAFSAFPSLVMSIRPSKQQPR